MALTYTFIEDSVLGNWTGRLYNIALDTSYPTGGYSIAPTRIKLGKTILGVQILAVNAAGSGIVQVVWDYVNNKLMAFRVATGTPTGTIAVTDGDVTVLGGAAGTALGITADSNAGALTKAAATTRTIPQATFGIAATTAAFTGAAGGQVAFAQVSNAVNLSAVTVRCLFIGR